MVNKRLPGMNFHFEIGPPGFFFLRDVFVGLGGGNNPTLGKRKVIFKSAGRDMKQFPGG